MKFGIHIETCTGPWFSLGIHVDAKNLYMDMHLFWWIISFGNLYWKDKLYDDRKIKGKEFWAAINATAKCPECGEEYDIEFDKLENSE